MWKIGNVEIPEERKKSADYYVEDMAALHRLLLGK